MNGRTRPLSHGLLVAATIVANAIAQQPAGDDGEWTMPGKNPQAWRFSGLDQINTSNAKDLKVAWTFSTGVNRGHEAAPIVVGDTMYVVTPFP
ncbi:MAG: PQQ-dependent dehydrogenase, methanol/ethanol family, partial [Chthoniobacterales bacterium]